MLPVFDIISLRTPTYRRNAERAGAKWPCVVCGKGIDPAKAKLWVTYPESMDCLIDPADEGDFNSMYPIGADCLRNNPQLQPYVTERGWVD